MQHGVSALTAMLEANKLGVVAAYTKHVAFTLDGTEWTLRPLTDPFWKKEKKVNKSERKRRSPTRTFFFFFSVTVPPADELASGGLPSFEKRRLRTPLPPFLDIVERDEATPDQQERRRASRESKLGRAPSGCYEVVASCVMRGGDIDYQPS